MELEKLFYIRDLETDNLVTLVIESKYFKKQKTYRQVIIHVLDTVSKALLISQKNKYEIFDLIVYVDRENTSQIDIKFFKDMIMLLTDTFPNRLNKCYIVNLPVILYSVITTLSIFLYKETKDKIVLMKGVEGELSRMPIVD